MRKLKIGFKKLPLLSNEEVERWISPGKADLKIHILNLFPVLLNVIGGNGQNFRTPVKVAEYLAEKYPVETVNLILPDALRNKLPPMSNFKFLKSTETGSFADNTELVSNMDSGDYNLLIGDLSKMINVRSRSG